MGRSDSASILPTPDGRPVMGQERCHGDVSPENDGKSILERKKKEKRGRESFLDKTVSGLVQEPPCPAAHALLLETLPTMS